MEGSLSRRSDPVYFKEDVAINNACHVISEICGKAGVKHMGSQIEV